jgi:hypothetical protein
MRAALAILFFMGTSTLFCQTGVVTISDNAGANALIEKHIQFNKEHGELPGFRIQVLSSSSLSDVKSAKSTFLQKFPEFKANIVYEAPNYKLRIGNYTNRFDANRYLQELLIYYPNSFIVKDMIQIAG